MPNLLFVLLLPGLLFSNSYSTPDIDEYCSKWENMVERMADGRDEGTPVEIALAGFGVLFKEGYIDNQTFEKSIEFLELVYAHPDMTPDRLAFYAKDSCIDYYLDVEDADAEYS